MKTWLTSDPHFGHVNMTDEGKNLCGRPFSSVAEMNAALLEEINATVSSSERLVILGDICLGKLAESLEVLGQIRAAELILVPGNHDRFSLAYHHRGDAATKREALRVLYEEQRPGTRALMDWVPSCWTWQMLVGGDDRLHTDPLNKALFSHYPYEGDSHGEDRAAFLRAEDDGRPIIHGHVHDEWDVRDRQFNVGVDVREFKPVSEDELAAWVEGLDV